MIPYKKLVLRIANHLAETKHAKREQIYSYLTLMLNNHLVTSLELMPSIYVDAPWATIFWQTFRTRFWHKYGSIV
jgi:hypothetical protein